jgi:uncharacterized phiE125 gp8 family phage protein
MALKPTLIEPPAVMPVTLEEARAFLRVDDTANDPVIEALIAAATAYCDGYSGILSRGLITQTWQQPVTGFPVAPATQIRLRLIPVQSIEEVVYFDSDGAPVIMDPADYALHTDAVGTYVSLAPGASWPTAEVRDDAVQITYVVGYGDAGADVPAALRQAILFMVSAWYDDRVTGTVPQVAARLLAAYRPMIW